MSDQRVTRSNENVVYRQLGSTAFGTDSNRPQNIGQNTPVQNPFGSNRTLPRSPPLNSSNNSELSFSNSNLRTSENNQPHNDSLSSHSQNPPKSDSETSSIQDNHDLESRESLDFDELQDALNETMAAITYADIKDLIPKYKGEPNKLEEVIQTNDAIFAQLSDPIDKKLFNLTVKTRLTKGLSTPLRQWRIHRLGR